MKTPHYLGALIGAQFAIDHFEIVAHRLVGQPHPGRNFAVAQALRQQNQNLLFAFAEVTALFGQHSMDRPHSLAFQHGARRGGAGRYGARDLSRLAGCAVKRCGN